MITIKKHTLYYWLVLFVLQALFIAWYQGLLSLDSKPAPPAPAPPAPVSNDMVMSAIQARLTKQAIEIVREDVEQATIRTSDLAIQALSALLPSSVRQRVLQELGTPGIEYMRDALDILDGKIIIQE